jgi:hypothetical protein
MIEISSENHRGVLRNGHAVSFLHEFGSRIDRVDALHRVHSNFFDRIICSHKEESLIRTCTTNFADMEKLCLSQRAL